MNRVVRRWAMLQKLLSGVVGLIVLGLAGTANATDLNIDFGDAFNTPASTFPGAGGQPGFWNEIDVLEVDPNRWTAWR